MSHDAYRVQTCRTRCRPVSAPCGIEVFSCLFQKTGISRKIHCEFYLSFYKGDTPGKLFSLTGTVSDSLSDHETDPLLFPSSRRTLPPSLRPVSHVAFRALLGNAPLFPSGSLVPLLFLSFFLRFTRDTRHRQSVTLRAEEQEARMCCCFVR